MCYGCFGYVLMRVGDAQPANEEALNHQLLEDAEGEDVCCLAVASNLKLKKFVQCSFKF